MTKSRRNQESEFEDSVVALRERFESLNEQKIKIQTQCESVKERLDELKKSAREQFGTDDVKELKKQLAKLNSENEKKRNKYEKDLDAIQDALDDIDECIEDSDEIE